MSLFGKVVSKIKHKLRGPAFESRCSNGIFRGNIVAPYQKCHKWKSIIIPGALFISLTLRKPILLHFFFCRIAKLNEELKLRDSKAKSLQDKLNVAEAKLEEAENAKADVKIEAKVIFFNVCHITKQSMNFEDGIR